MSSTKKLQIIEFIKKNKGPVTAPEVAQRFKISRQMASRYLAELVKESVLHKTGSTRKAVYHFGKGPSSSALQPQSLSLVKNLSGLSEDQVFTEVDLRLNLKTNLPENIHSIAYYAFTEMLNNAIDHSNASKAQILVELTDEDFHFSVTDKGVGVFARVQKNFNLESEYVAVEHVVKGKQTTQPEAHSGQGIFFTSRIADKFELQSHKISYSVDNRSDNRVMGEIRYLKGTKVSFWIKRKSRKQLDRLFKDYADADFEFDRTDVRVKLRKDIKLISRSQAKRLLLGLEKYKIITFDFKGVREVGQGFVDQIFRIFAQRHPEIQMIYVNANPAVEFMIQRSRATG